MYLHSWRRYVIGAIVVFTLATATFLLWPSSSKLDGIHAAGMPAADTIASVVPAEVDGSANIVSLSAEKQKAAAIQIEPVTLGTLTQRHSVPGRVVYNDTRHIQLFSPTSGILTQVLVRPGDAVKAWQIVAWLTSPEIGSARADVLQRQAEAELSQRLLERADTLRENVTLLTTGLRAQSDFDALRDQLSGRVLGDYREKLFGAYSRMQLAEKMVANSAKLGESGGLSGKVLLGYQADFLAARAALEAACEQADLEVWQQHQQAEATAHDVKRRLEIARQHLSSLLLNEAATNAATGTLDTKELGANEDDLEHLSLVAVRAPFAGTIESRTFSASERVKANDTLFVLADTSSMWISAEIRESDWAALSIDVGHTVQVTIPAIGNATLSATVEFIGREVSPTTNSISITAKIDNADGRLRPGLFARVAVPVSEKGKVLMVPANAVQRQGEQTFVFVAESPHRFRRVDVAIRDVGEERIEIVRGLKAGDRVVTKGAFVLKSELLLESEGE